MRCGESIDPGPQLWRHRCRHGGARLFERRDAEERHRGVLGGRVAPRDYNKSPGTAALSVLVWTFHPSRLRNRGRDVGGTVGADRLERRDSRVEPLDKKAGAEGVGRCWRAAVVDADRRSIGSLPQSAGSGIPAEMASPHLAGLLGPVTRSGSCTVKIACVRFEFGDGLKLTKNI